MEIVKVLRNCQLTGGQAIINSIGLFSCAIKTKPEMSVYAIIILLLNTSRIPSWSRRRKVVTDIAPLR